MVTTTGLGSLFPTNMARPNKVVNRTAQQLRCWVRSGLRPTPAGYVQRCRYETERVYQNSMRLDVYGRFQLEVLRENGTWIAYRLGLGTRERDNDVVIPPSLEATELAEYIDDLFHELARPGQRVILLS